MPKLLDIIKRNANVIVLVYPIFCLLYWIWLGILFRDVYGAGYEAIYWDGYFLFNILLKFVAIVGFFLFLVSLFSSSLQRGWILFASVFIPVACTMFFFGFLLPAYIQVDKARFNDRTYFILYNRNFVNHYHWILMECPPFGILCEHVSLYYDEYGRYNKDSNARFIVDGFSKELHVVIDHDLFYTIGSPTREYVLFLAETRLEDYTYHLSRYENEGSALYNLYKCNFHFACVKMPFLYTIPREEVDDREFDLEGDFFTNNIKIWSANSWKGLPWEVIFSYDNVPRCYVEACSIPDQ